MSWRDWFGSAPPVLSSIPLEEVAPIPATADVWRVAEMMRVSALRNGASSEEAMRAAFGALRHADLNIYLGPKAKHRNGKAERNFKRCLAHVVEESA